MIRFAQIVRVFGLVLAVALAFPISTAFAQQAPLIGIEPIRASLDRIEADTRRGDTSVRALGALMQTLSPLRDELRVKIADLEPRLADLDVRLQKLGPATAPGAAPEDPAIAAERLRLTQQRADLDAATKQLQLLDARAGQLATALSEQRRTTYADTLFRRSPNVLDPFYWRDAIAAVPDATGRIVRLGQDWWRFARERGGTSRMATVALALAGLLMFAIGLVRWWRRVGWAKRIGTRYGKALAALLVFARAALAMPLAVLVVMELLRLFEFVPPDNERIIAGLVIGTAIAALARAAALSVLAPDDPARRLVSFDDSTAQWLFWHLTWGGRLLGAVIVLRAIHRTVGAPDVLDAAAKMLFAILIGALLVHLLVGRRDETDTEPSRRIPGVRLLAWIVIAAIAASLLTGYASFAAFIAGRAVFTVTLLATLFLLLIVTDALIDRTLSAESPRGRAIAYQLGIDPRQLGLLGKVASGIIRALFVLLILALAVGRWEVVAADFLLAVRDIAFGIRFGDFTISFGAVFGALALFLIIVALTRVVQRWLETDVLPQTAIEPSLRLSIVTVLGYVGFIIALIAALSEIGIDPQKIALVAGALSVGIGFGLQSIVSNFVSGLILLAERPIRVGDQIVVKNEEGFVRRISVRATEIETFDKASVIIPNSELITGVVKNWTHANTLGRINIKINVAYDCDPDQVIEILKACVDEHPAVLKQPPPAVLLSEFGAAALAFEIFCIVANLSDRGGIKSDIQISLLKRLRAAGIELSPPQDVRLSGATPPMPGQAENA